MDPTVGVDGDRGAQDDGLGAQVVGHLHEAVDDGEGDVVGALQPLPAPQDQALRGLRFDAQLEAVGLQGLLAAPGGGRTGRRVKTRPPKARACGV